jgi:leucyl-tRNA synthetase
VDEPFTNLLTQGMVIKDGAKMSKSKGNVVDPNALIEKYGADTARLFSLFAAPPEKDLDWSDQGVDGSYRFLNRVWKLVHDTLPLLANAGAVSEATLEDDAKALRRSVHKTIRKVTEDIEDRFHFNTAIAAIMEMVNFIHGCERKNDPRNAAVLKEAMESLVLLLVPFVPHIASELWQALGHTEGVDAAGWPTFDPAAAADEELLVKPFIDGKTVRKVISVPGKLVNIVVG